MSEEIALSKAKKTKKQLILELLEEGKYTVEEMAAKADSTVPYVWKTKSELKKTGFNANLKSRAEQREESVGSLPQRTLVSSKEDNKSPATTAEVHEHIEKDHLKVIYREFLAGKKPPQIVAEHGYPAEIVEAEYRTFLKYAQCDIYDLQKWLMAFFKVKESPEPRIMELSNKYSRQGYLGNADFKEIIELVYTARRNEIEEIIDLVMERTIDWVLSKVSQENGDPVEIITAMLRIVKDGRTQKQR